LERIYASLSQASFALCGIIVRLIQTQLLDCFVLHAQWRKSFNEFRKPVSLFTTFSELSTNSSVLCGNNFFYYLAFKFGKVALFVWDKRRLTNRDYASWGGSK